MTDRISNRQGPSPTPPTPPPAAPAAVPLAPGDELALGTANRLLPLPGQLDDRLMLNSNHPEILLGPGIAVSSLGLAGPAHLNQSFEGPFEVFAHHQNRFGKPLYQSVVLHNPGNQPVTVAVGPSASFSTSEAPYRDGPPEAGPDPEGKLSSGPGDAVSAALLRGQRAVAESHVTLAPGETRILHTRTVPPRNEVTSQFLLEAAGPVQAAAVFTEEPGRPQNVQATLQAGKRLPPNPDDLAPTPPDAPGKRIYGRVAGIQVGCNWQGRLAPLALAGEVSKQWILDSLVGHDGGTGQVQAAPLLKRYADTAYAAHANYGVQYDLSLPLHNPGDQPRQVALYLDSLNDRAATAEAPAEPNLLESMFGFLLGLFGAKGVSRAYRGAIAVEVNGETRYVHLGQTLGQTSPKPILELTLPPGQASDVRLRLYYPADATPAHVLRLESHAGNV